MDTLTSLFLALAVLVIVACLLITAHYAQICAGELSRIRALLSERGPDRAA